MNNTTQLDGYLTRLVNVLHRAFYVSLQTRKRDVCVGPMIGQIMKLSFGLR